MTRQAGSHAALVLLALASLGSDVFGRTSSRPVSQDQAQEESWDELVARFEGAHKEWKARIRTSEGVRERAAARREDPTPTFAPAFQQMADGGEIRALFWLLDNLSDLDLSRSERKQRRLALFESMVGEHAGNELFIDGMARLHADPRLVKEHGIETVERLTHEAIRVLSSETARDSLRLGLASRHSMSTDAPSTKKALTLLDAIIAGEQLPAEELERASDLRFEILHLRVGCEAPDFEGQTVDGEPVHLSDHRGKVVVLDFFGFW